MDWNANFDFDRVRNLSIGTVDFVSPNEIKVSLDTSAPKNIALNTGTPSLFPRINSFVLIPNEVGALVGIISWLAVEHSPFPKRTGYKDFDVVDLPFPLRKISVTPLGTLKQSGKSSEGTYELERGVYSFPSVGDSVVLPTDEQLKSIVENADGNARVTIGVAPIAANASVKINPDRLFGRHVAVLGNTGSGKSCSVAGLIRWSLETASEELNSDETLNARFVILDPNGEYTRSFDGLNTPTKIFKVDLKEEEIAGFKQIKVPGWLWNSYEWSAFSNAAARAQRPILRRALRDLRSGGEMQISDREAGIRSHYVTFYGWLKREIAGNGYKEKATEFGKVLLSQVKDARGFKSPDELELSDKLETLALVLKGVTDAKDTSWPGRDGLVVRFDPFERQDVQTCLDAVEQLSSEFGGINVTSGPNEDAPVRFALEALPNHLEKLAAQQNVTQFLDFLVMRIRTMLSDTRMKEIVGDDLDVTLESWLQEMVDGVSVIDLSLVPSDISHLVVAIISRLIFEALQRYRRMNEKVLPTVVVMEEAHNFVRRYNENMDEISSAQLCTESFERIAREGRKFGMSLALSSQRPSELSPTVLSQCNTFLLHRLVNDKDQELVGRLVPDNIGMLLKELPILPTRKAILLGWATAIPILVEMRELAEGQRPKSEDPDFWAVWTRKKERLVDWKLLAESWQELPSSEMGVIETDASTMQSTPHPPTQAGESSIKNNQPNSSSMLDDDDIPF